MDAKLEARRSRVRVLVTYLFALAYVGSAGYLLWYFVEQQNTEAALAVFASVSAFASAVVGFWFGSRQTDPPLLLNQEVPDA